MQARHHLIALNSFNHDTIYYGGCILLTFGHFCCFLNLSYHEAYVSFIMGMYETTLASGQILPSVHKEKSYLGKVGYPVLTKRVSRLSKLPLHNEKLM